MSITLEDELLVALFDRRRTDSDRPEIASAPFSVGALARLSRRSVAAVEEALFDLHRSGCAKVVVEVHGGVVSIVSGELTDPQGTQMAASRLSRVRALWQARADQDRHGGVEGGRG